MKLLNKIKFFFKKKVTLYLVCQDKEGTKIEYILSKKEQLQEYLRKRFIVNHFEHYLQWCKLRGYDYRLHEIEQFYIDTSLEGDNGELNEQVWVFRETFTLDGLAAAFRILHHILPIGTSFETNAEQQVMDETIKMIKDKMEEIGSNLENKDKVGGSNNNNA